MGRGVAGFAEAFAQLKPEAALVYGDGVESFAAAAAASPAKLRIAHLQGGDRAIRSQGEAASHAITKLAHIHLPATALAAERIIAMGEEVRSVHLAGSPALDELERIPPAPDHLFRKLGKPEMIFLMHPNGRGASEECITAQRILGCCMRFGNVLALHPNHEPGREGILRAIHASRCPALPHLPRRDFIGLLRRANLIVGNSSAGIVEAASVGAWCINIGLRQAGRDRARNVTDVEDVDLDPDQIDMALQQLLFHAPYSGRNPWGDGRASERIAETLATFDFLKHPLRKRSSY